MFALKIDGRIEQAEFILINSCGQYIYQQPIEQGIYSIVTNQFSKDLYYYVLLENKQVVKSGNPMTE